MANYDPGAWLKKKLIELQDNKVIKGLVLASIPNVEVDMPYDYGVISRHTKSFVYKNYEFNFNAEERYKYLEHIKTKN